ncbi:hypothetical protein HWV62_42928 [Athelia sp. TMB]|nr:hypothetical protein HWV62_42928 [Athelia sp. TMB]
MADVPAPSSSSAFSFRLTPPPDPSSPRFGPLLGHARLTRPDGSPDLTIDTPGLLTTTSRGVVPHLSRDHHRAADAVRWVNIPFETFLEQVPPVPTLQGGAHPLHTFLGFPPARNTLVMALRDPACARELPPNGNDHVAALTLRGVRKVSASDWRAYVAACNPDLVVALSDTPHTPPPHSQKRLTKSLARSAAWLADLLRPFPPPPDSASPATTTTTTARETHPLNVLVHMAGGPSAPARAAFAESLVEPLYGPDAALVAPLPTLDAGVAGYTFDLVPLRTAEPPAPITDLLRASLAPLPRGKLRMVNAPASPHEILRLVRDVGVDVFDAAWAQDAASIGVALDFVFPVPTSASGAVVEKGELGHNLYDDKYAMDFSRLADALRAGRDSTSTSTSTMPVCPCAACSPRAPATHIAHSALDHLSFPSPSPTSASAAQEQEHLPPLTRAYLHHLLHTHEMSAHALLALHNLAVLDAFFAGIRAVLSDGSGREGFEEEVARFEEEVERFAGAYDEGMGVVGRARGMWRGVDRARGKGRLARERDAQAGAGAEVPAGETIITVD